MSTTGLGTSFVMAATTFVAAHALGVGIADTSAQSATEIGFGLLKEVGSLGLLTLVLWKLGPTLLRDASAAHRAEMAAMTRELAEVKAEMQRMREIGRENNLMMASILSMVAPEVMRARFAAKKAPEPQPPET